ALAAAPVKDVTLLLRSVFPGDRNVPAIIESFLQRPTDFFFAGQRRNPPLKLLVRGPRRNLKRIRINTPYMRRRPCRFMIKMPSSFSSHFLVILGGCSRSMWGQPPPAVRPAKPAGLCSDLLQRIVRRCNLHQRMNRRRRLLQQPQSFFVPVPGKQRSFYGGQKPTHRTKRRIHRRSLIPAMHHAI